MSLLSVYPDTDPGRVTHFRSFESMRDQLATAGILFERWSATRPLAADAGQDDILAAYAPEIERLKSRGGYVTSDVVRLKAPVENLDAVRGKFLSEHTHSEDEVRFFVEGQGLFCIHAGDRVLAMLCTAGDLIAVPAGTRHWFDMGPEPHFAAIRLFRDPRGWVAEYTGDSIADRFPRLEPVAQGSA